MRLDVVSSSAISNQMNGLIRFSNLAKRAGHASILNVCWIGLDWIRVEWIGARARANSHLSKLIKDKMRPIHFLECAATRHDTKDYDRHLKL